MPGKIEEKKICCICDRTTMCGGNPEARYCCYCLDLSTMTRIVNCLLIGWLMLEVISQGTMLYLAFDIKFLSKTCYYLWQNILLVIVVNLLTIIVLIFSAKVYRYTYMFYSIQILVRMLSAIACITTIFPDSDYSNTCFFTNETDAAEPSMTYNNITWMTIALGFTFVISVIFYISLIVTKCCKCCSHKKEINYLTSRVQELVEKERELECIPSAQLVQVAIEDYTESSSSEECEGLYGDSSHDSSEELSYHSSPEINSFIENAIRESKDQYTEQI